MNRRCTFLPVLCTLVALLTAACARPTATPVPPTPRPANTQAPAAPTPTETPTPGPTATPTPDPNTNPLTGEPVADPTLLQHRPILVRYGHDRQSRPQSGLSSANMVYEELAEGNFVTRITGVFLSEVPEVAGPIRSTRLAVFEMLHQLDAALVDAGASDPIMWMLSTLPQYPQFRHTAYGAEYFFRSQDKVSPYNLYVHLPQVRARMIADGTDKPVHVHNMVFSAAPPEGTTAEHVHVPYPGVAPADFRYDAASGSYLRFVEGVPHSDALNGQQLAPQNVVVIYCEHKPQPQIVEDKLGNVAIMVWWVGTGRAQVFRDGVMVEGQWLRPEAADQMRLVDADGQDIPLKPGQTWIEIVPLDYKVTVE